MGLGGIKLAEYADPRAVSRGVGIAANAASIVDRRVRRSDDVSWSRSGASASGLADYSTLMSCSPISSPALSTTIAIVLPPRASTACASTVWR